MWAYAVIYPVALAVAAAFYFLLIRHWIRSRRCRTASGERRQLHAAEYQYAERAQRARRHLESLEETLAPEDGAILAARAEFEKALAGTEVVDAAWAAWDSKKHRQTK